MTPRTPRTPRHRAEVEPTMHRATYRAPYTHDGFEVGAL